MFIPNSSIQTHGISTSNYSIVGSNSVTQITTTNHVAYIQYTAQTNIYER
jgi:hypothetical protein